MTATIVNSPKTGDVVAAALSADELIIDNYRARNNNAADDLWHVIYQQDSNYPGMDSLKAMPLATYDHLGETRKAIHTTPGHVWHDEQSIRARREPEFTMTYIGLYKLVDNHVSMTTGRFTGTFRKVVQG